MSSIELNENFDFTKICRLCLNENKGLISIFDFSSFKIQFSIIISECTGVMIIENDELPKRICLECIVCLNKFYQFRTLVVNSEHRLHRSLNKFWNNVNKDVMIENLNNIKEEVELNGEPSCLIKSEVKDSLVFEDISEMENKLEIDTNKTFTESTMISNFEQIQVQPNFSCQPYPQMCKNETILNNHDEISHKTDLCSSIFLSHVTRDKKPSKSGKLSYVCRECNKVFVAKSSLEIHKRTHSGEKPYTCNQCGKLFARSSDLRRHEKFHKGEKLHICKQCGKGFTMKYNLEIHERIHSGEKPYICYQCGKLFSNQTALKKHEQTHKGEKPYVCNQCNKGFGTRSDLKVHGRIHTGEKPFNCTQCGKSFSHLTGLKIHERNHKGEKPFTCKECHKSFSTNSHLKNHERVHTGEKPYICKQCGKPFAQRNCLKQHEKSHKDTKSE